MMKQALIVAALLASATAFAPSARFGVGQSRALSAEWTPKEGEGWEEKDYVAEIEKLEAEAEERLEAKIAEMMSKVDATGAK
ncbi:hypothetical protein ACA910_016015 [Epithemia clementina (nom. ined.)]